MAGAYRRKSDRARGAAGKWTGWYRKADGSRGFFAGTTDKSMTIRMAQQKEAEEAMIREGIVDPKDRAARDAARKPIAEHIEEYRLHLLAKGDKEKHAAHVAGALRRLMDRAALASVADIRPDPVQAALGRMVAGGASARTANHALGAARAFARWLHANGRLRDDPLRGLTSRFGESADVRYLRRDLAPGEVERLAAAAEAGPDYPPPRPGRRRDARATISGVDRGMAYRIASGTGFRAEEIRSLTPESFDLGPSPTIAVAAAYTKNRKEATQPIRRDLADRLRVWLAGKAPGAPVLPLPEKTARMLRFDLAAAGIPAAGKATTRREGGRTVRVVHDVVDFHALRATYITHLIMAGVDPKTVQELARHSTVTLTIGRYTKTNEERKRAAIEGAGPPSRSAHDESHVQPGASRCVQDDTIEGSG